MSSPSNDIVERFSTHLKNVLTRALCFVVENERHVILPEHLLWALGTERGGIGAELLAKLGVKAEALRVLATETASPASKPTDDPASPQLSEEAKRAIEKAVLTANAHEHRYVGTEHLLAGLIQVRAETLETFFKKTKIDRQELSEQLAIALRTANRYPELAAAIPSQTPEAVSATPAAGTEEQANRPQALTAFGRELTSKDAQPKLDPVIGREREIGRVMEILCRRTKNNPLLLGEPGVGKTAIVEGLAKRIHAGDVPPALRGRRIISVDLAAMIAGTMYRGEFEQRVRQVVEEARKHPDVILFIDEIHTVVGAGAATGSLDAANILKPALARGELHCIGATTLGEFKKYFETDAALERRFQPVIVDEPTPERTREILQGLAPAYEAHHHVRYAPEALEAAVRLSVRFLQDRRLPDKAIDLMDEAGAAERVRAKLPGPAEERLQLERQLADLREKKNEAVLHERFQEAMDLKRDEEAIEKTLAGLATDPRADEAKIVEAEDIARVVSRTSGLSLQDVLHDAADPVAFEQTLGSRVFGQQAVVRATSRALARAKAGLGDPRRPLGSFLFLGPSGVGKTELAKAMAEAAFKDPKALIRLDMSEYAESFTASKLVGAPAGYVGYKDGAKLTDRVRQRPHAIVLFDEIEKAHPDVQHLLLQLLEEGELTDASGVPVSFRNAIIVLTSNAGADRFRTGAIGFSSNGTAPATDIRKDLEDRFRPELLNRIEHVLLFEPLSKDALREVADKQLRALVARLAARQRTLTVSEGIATFLAARADTSFGARDIHRLIQTHVEDQLAEHLSETSRDFHVDTDGERVVIKAA